MRNVANLRTLQFRGDALRPNGLAISPDKRSTSAYCSASYRDE